MATPSMNGTQPPPISTDLRSLPSNLPGDIQGLLKRATDLQNQGQTEQSSVELSQIVSFIRIIAKNAQNQQQTQQASIQNGPKTVPPPLDAPVTNGVPLSEYPVVPPSSVQPPAPKPIVVTPNQMSILKAQIQALQFITRGQPVPPQIQHAIYVPDEIDTTLAEGTSEQTKGEQSSSPDDVAGPSGSTSSVSKETEPRESNIVYPNGHILERDTNSAIFPYNAFVNPLSTAAAALRDGRAHKVIIPTLMPIGLDPYQVMAERQRSIEARIERRIQELSALPSTTSDRSLELPITNQNDGSPPSSTKLRALIELKALRLREKQRALRSSIVNRMQEASSLAIDRKVFRRTRKPVLRDARQTEGQERQQRNDRELRAKKKHLDYLGSICTHGQALITAGRENQSRAQKLGKAILKLHVDTEKEEQKRIERISKERLKALKADDEEAYMKLIDTAKDTRITHLLRQTDAYLDSLSQAVRAQQNDDVHKHGAFDHQPYETEDGPTDETTFGASRPEDAEESRNGKVDYYGVAHRISEKITVQPKLLVGGQLKEYQIKGLQWMVSLYNNRLNGILADEMGLGKTIQTISLICFLIEVKREPGPFLVIVPLSTLTNWTLEFKKWAPGVITLVYNGSPALRKALQPQLRSGNYQVVLTTYEYIIREKAALSRIKWLHMIIDEGHRMKNTQSKLSQTLTQFYSTRYRIILTGTPLQNNLPELWALLNFVLPRIFNSVKSFEEWFNTPFANTGSQDKLELNEEETLLVIRRLHKVLRPFLLRRLKKDVESELPDKVEKVVKCKMSGLQSQLYLQMKKHGILFDEEVKGKQVGIKGLNNTIMQFRKICQHPFVFPQIEDRINPSRSLNMTIVRSAGKVALLDQLLPKLFATGHRVLIFFQMTNIMDIMADYFNFRGYKHFRLDGSTKPEERAHLLVQFNDPSTDVNLFMLSTRAGGLGLNLQSADTVIIYDSDWNPHADLQAQDRAHRIGQKKDVRIFRFVTEKSIEEVMLARARSKLDMDGKVIQAGRFDNKSTAEEQEEYLRSLLDQDQADETEESASMNDDEINEIVARTEEEGEIFRRMDGERAYREEQEWHAAGNTGPVPNRLMQIEELPEVYQRDEPIRQDSEPEGLSGRGQRVRASVRYNDGLTDDQWAEALEDGGQVEDAGDRRSRPGKNRAVTRIESSPELDSPAEDDDWGNPKKKKGKGKARAEARPSPMPLKRKRAGAKAPSVTPSMVDDEEEILDTKRRKVAQAAKGDTMPSPVRERMKKVFAECYRVVQACTDNDGRQRCELFKELPSKKEYPDYYQQIANPIAMSNIRKRSGGIHYKTVSAYADDWRLMFANARQYNQEGSWVYEDANELSKVFEAVFARETANTDLPGATSNLATASYQQWSLPQAPQQQMYQGQAQSARKQPAPRRRDSNWSDDEYRSE